MNGGGGKDAAGYRDNDFPGLCIVPGYSRLHTTNHAPDEIRRGLNKRLADFRPYIEQMLISPKDGTRIEAGVLSAISRLCHESDFGLSM